ncbi:MAG: FdtA/QdtA family cupin domain-containing protein [Aliishimia sp.]
MTDAQLIKGVTIDVSPDFSDARGNLSARQVGNGLPFTPKRLFFITDVPENTKRGDHAHKECHQLVLCLNGQVDCVVDNGVERTRYCLNSRDTALHLPPMIWGIQENYSAGAILLVLASHEFDPDDYIRDYEEFLALSSKR